MAGRSCPWWYSTLDSTLSTYRTVSCCAAVTCQHTNPATAKHHLLFLVIVVFSIAYKILNPLQIRLCPLKYGPMFMVFGNSNFPVSVFKRLEIAGFHRPIGLVVVCVKVDVPIPV